MGRLLLVCVGLAVSASCISQTPPLTPAVTIAATPLLIGKATTIQVLVTNPAFSPVPSGPVTLDFGDGSDPSALTIANEWVGTTHTYATAGTFTITASYGGDGNFAPATATLTAVSIVSAPAYKIRNFGDSLTGGVGLPLAWNNMLAGALGWQADPIGCGGCKTNDLAPLIYQESIDSAYVSTWLLGQNDSPGVGAGETQFRQAVLAQNAWLGLVEGNGKLRAQNNAVAQTGSWAASDIYTTTGLLSKVSGSSLTATVPGNVIYVGLSSTMTSDYTVDVQVDGVDEGPISPVSAYAGEYQAADQYGARFAIGGESGIQHTVQVVCTNPGTSGCYVDWIGGNGTLGPQNLPPYVFMAVSYTTLQPNPQNSNDRQQIVRDVAAQLQGDGLSIHLADIASMFYGPAVPQCVGDGVHPNDCGNQIEETVFLSAADFLATEAQRIDIGTVPVAMVGEPLTLNMATATSGLPVAYTLVSGPATFAGNQLTFTQPGTATMEADQAGNSTTLPAMAVQFNISGVYETATALTSSELNAIVGDNVTLTATVTANGGPVTSGMVTLNMEAATLGTFALNSSGQASLSTTTLPLGTDVVTASYGGSASYSASTSAPVSVTVEPPVVATPTFSPAGGSYIAPQTVTINDATPGAAIYYTTDGKMPTADSTQYAGSITISSTETLNAIATANGYATSAVATATYTISPPNFTLSASPTALRVERGGSGTATLTITPQNGFNAAVTFACSGLPIGATCSFSPATVTPAGSAATTTLTISATNQTASARDRRDSKMAGLAVALLVCGFGWRWRRRSLPWVWAILLLAGLGALTSCGGKRAPVTSTVTVSATSGSLDQTATVTLTVE